MLVAPSAAEYGVLGTLLLACAGGLVWHLRTTTTALLDVVKANTEAVTRLEGALKDQRLCPYRDLISRMAEEDLQMEPARRSRAAVAGAD